MQIEIEGQASPPSSACIASFESYCRVTLPPDFKEFLLYGNGGVPIKKTFMAGAAERVLERFLPLLEKPAAAGVLGQYDMAVVEGQIGERLTDDPEQVGCLLVPFAALFAGDFLCFDYRNSTESPSVVIWDHERSDEFAPHTEFVAPSFSNLLSHLL